MENVVVEDDGKNQHGLPRGYHFVPKDIELFRLLDDKLAGRPLPHPLPNIFHDVKILDYHPAELYEKYKTHEEAGFIYFFSHRKFLRPGGKKTRPSRIVKVGGWTASGGSKLVRRGGVNGYEFTLVFSENRKKKKSDGKNEWGMHEYTKIIGSDKQVEDLALYRLYKVKKKKNEEGQHVSILSNGSPKSEEQAQASVGQTHDYDQQYALAAPPCAPGPRSWGNPPNTGCMGLTGSPSTPLMASSVQATAVNYWPTSPEQHATATPTWPQQQAVNDFELADWDNTPPMVPSLPPLLAPSTVSGPAAVGHNLPTSQQHDAEYPGPAVSNEQLLNMLPPPPLPAPAAEGGYLDDEFKVLCEMQQEQPAASLCWFPMLDDDYYLPMLTDEENYAPTLDELLGPMHDDGDVPGTRQTPEIREEDPDDQV